MSVPFASSLAPDPPPSEEEEEDEEDGMAGIEKGPPGRGEETGVGTAEATPVAS